MDGKVLITGAHGMLGRNLLEHPSLQRWAVLAPTRRELDLQNYAAVESYLKAHRPSHVIHAAGLVGGIQANVARPVDFLIHNADVGRNVVLAARTAHVTRLINLGSSCMYPRDAPNPLREESILDGKLEPTNEGYALAKILVGRLCEYIGRENVAFRYRTLIPCNLYGRYDKFAASQSHLVAAIIHKIHEAKTAGIDSVEIWGEGNARREFMYAGDCADALAKALDKYDDLPDLMNIGVGRDHSVDDYYRAVAHVIGWTGRFIHDLSKPAGIKQKRVSIDRQMKWGWEPRTSLNDGLRRTYSYYLSARSV